MGVIRVKSLNASPSILVRASPKAVVSGLMVVTSEVYTEGRRTAGKTTDTGHQSLQYW